MQLVAHSWYRVRLRIFYEEVRPGEKSKDWPKTDLKMRRLSGLFLCFFARTFRCSWLVVHTGYGFDVLGETKLFLGIQRLAQTDRHSNLVKNWVNLLKVCEVLLSRRTFETRPCMDHQLLWKALAKNNVSTKSHLKSSRHTSAEMM